MKKICILMTVLTLMCLLVSCSGGISSDEAKESVESLFLCLSGERYEDAAAMCHPMAEITADVFSEGEDELSIDFADGITVTKYTGFKASFYNSSVDGSLYELSGVATCGETTLDFSITVVRNDEGYGIGHISLLPAEE